jgi:hypothetical protein
MSDQALLQAAFARHETFHPRYGWLVKGTAAAFADPTVFLREDATTVLGVGKNMVRAMRYWCVATKLLSEERNADNPRLRDTVATEFARRLLGDQGWDPYLEDPASLWLLHWKLLAAPCIAPSWWSTFNTPRMRAFDDDALVRELRALCEIHEWHDIVDNSLAKDARCLLRMYAGVTEGRDLPEDSVDSPFAELDLIRPLPGAGRMYSVAVGPKPTLPDAVVTYAVLDFLRLREASARVVTVAGLANTAGSPGRAFALTEAALADALDRVSAARPDLLTLTHAAGVRQVALAANAEPFDILEAHYRAEVRT